MPSVLSSIRPGVLSLGIDIGGTTIKLGVCTSEGEVRASTIANTASDNGADAAIERITIAARRLIAETGPVSRAGIGIPGELDLERRVLHRANHLPGWTDVAFPQRLGEALGIPVALENDANCAAWGEFVAGAGRGSRSLALFTIGTGIGGGLVIDGELWIGVAGSAGAFGHIGVNPQGPLCRCGQPGCLEPLASGTAIAESAGVADAMTAFAAASRGDARALAAIERAAEALSVAVATVIHIVQPEVVALGGGVAAGTTLLDRVRSGVARRVRPAWRAPVRLTLAHLGVDAGWIGAALWGLRHTALTPNAGAEGASDPPSIRPSVRPSQGPSVHQSDRPSTS
ncbi:MAG: ROK family protein [Gemmatimonadaceae bacterium]